MKTLTLFKWFKERPYDTPSNKYHWFMPDSEFPGSPMFNATISDIRRLIMNERPNTIVIDTNLGYPQKVHEAIIDLVKQNRINVVFVEFSPRKSLLNRIMFGD